MVSTARRPSTHGSRGGAVLGARGDRRLRAPVIHSHLTAGENITISVCRARRAGRCDCVRRVLSMSARPLRAKAHAMFIAVTHRMHHERGPVSRVYATVLEPGVITTGDPAILEPRSPRRRLTAGAPHRGRKGQTLR